MTGSLLIGTHTYPAVGDAARRQAAAIATLGGLARAGALDVQFRREPHRIDGLPSIDALSLDSCLITGRDGPRRAIVRELLDVLAREAAARGCAYFCFANADILWSQAAVDWILSSGREACVFSRQDVDPATGAGAGIELAGLDVFAFATGVWPRIRRRYRDYLVGQMTWDNVYAAVTMCHADAVIENRLGLVRHERHATDAAPAPPYAAYTRLLAALDARYFHLWCTYWGRVKALREQGAPEEAERALATETFAWPPPPLDRLREALRGARARWRYARARLAVE